MNKFLLSREISKIKGSNYGLKERCGKEKVDEIDVEIEQKVVIRLEVIWRRCIKERKKKEKLSRVFRSFVDLEFWWCYFIVGFVILGKLNFLNFFCFIFKI